MSLRVYPEYRDSDVPWLGALPSHWAALPLKRIARLRTDRAAATDFQVALENIESGGVGRFVETDSEFGTDGVGFSTGDVLFGKLRPYLVKVWVANRDGEAVGDFHVLRPVSDCSSRYLFYQLVGDQIIDVINGSTFGAKMPRASWDFMGQLFLARPPLQEQEGIAAFLDRETGKIDALVAEQERLIALLKEKRQALISHAVTKGLDPNVPMKDSGVDWLGEMPVHWAVARLKHVSPLVTVGIVIEPAKLYRDEGVPALRSLNVKPGRIQLDNVVRISEQANELHRKSRLSAGDLVAVRTGQPGTTAVVPPELEGCNCVDLIVIRRPHSGDERFLCYYLGSDAAQFQFSGGAEGAIQQHFNVETAANLVLPWPSRLEQSRIVEYLDADIAKLDELAVAASETKFLLSERRSALISAAVTGKIDVRGLA